MADKRDVELIIRARDLGSKTFKEVAGAIDQVTSSLDGQLEAAKKGDVSIAQLQKTYKDLQAAGEALIKQQGLIDLYKNLAAQVQEAEQRATAARASFKALQETQAGAESVTKKEEAALNALSKAADNADKRLESLRSSLANQAARLDAVGVSTATLAVDQEKLVSSAQQVGGALSAVGGALDSYDTHLASTRAAEAALADNNTFAKKVAEAAELRQAAEYVTFWTNALQAAEVKEAEFAATHAFEQKLAEAKELRQAAEYVQFWTQALDQAEAKEAQLKTFNGFRNIADQAVAGAKGIETFSVAVQQLDNSTSRVAASLRGILDPTAAAMQSLDGLEGRVNSVTTQIGAADGPLRKYQDSINELGAIQSNLLRQAGDVDAFKNQEAAVQRASAAYDAARNELLGYAGAVRIAMAPSDEMVASVKKSEAALQQAGKELTAQQTRLATLGAALHKAGIDTNELTAAEGRLTAASQKVATALGNVDRAQKGQNSATGKFLGLRPYELQNLSFQLNDVFTQLASGTPITQVFAQQGGQIVQLFPGLISGFVRLLPVIGPLIVVVGTLAAAFKNLGDHAASVKEFTAALAINVDGNRANAQALADTAHALDVYGTSLKIARAEIREFIDKGLDPAQFENLGKTAEDLSHVLGIKVPDAAKQLAEGLSGGYEAVVKLDDSLNFLSASQRDHIKTLFDEGHATEATAEAYGILQKKAQEAADKQRGDWGNTIRNIGGAWNNFLTFLGNLKPIKDTITWLQNLARVAVWATSFLPGATKTVNGVDVPGAPTPPKATPTNNAPSERELKAAKDINDDLNDRRVIVEKLSAAERLRLAGIKAVNDAESKGVHNTALLEQIRANAQQTEQFKITKEANQKGAAADRKAAAAARKAEAERRREEAKLKAEQAKRDSLEGQLIQDLRQMDATVGNKQDDTLTGRLDAITEKYAKIQDTIDKFQKAGGKTIDGQSIDVYKERVAQNEIFLKQQATLKFFDEQINNQLDQRSSKLKTINDLAADGTISSVDAYRQAQAVQKDLGDQIAQTAADALEFAQSIAGANPSPALVKFMEQMKATLHDVSRSGSLNDQAAAVGRSQIQAQESKLNGILSERNDLVSLYKTLLDQGQITQSEFDQKTRAAYEAAIPLLQRQTVEFQDLLLAMKRGGSITTETYNALIAKLQQVNAQAQFVSEGFTRVRETIIGAISGGIVNSFDQISEAIGNAIAGTGSWNDALNSLWRSALSFAAQFLKQLADVILQLAVLQAVKNLPFLNQLTNNVLNFAGLGAAATTASAALATGGSSAGAAVAAGGTTAAAAVTAAGTGAGAAIAAGGATLTAAAGPLLAAAAAISAAATQLAAAASVQAATGLAGVFHGGWKAGRAPTRSRKVSPSIFANAPRYHSGRPMVGLKPDEQAAILQKGETVLTKKQAQDANKTVDGPGGINAIRNVLVFDQKDVAGALQSSAGEKVLISFVKRNAATIKAMIN